MAFERSQILKRLTTPAPIFAVPEIRAWLRIDDAGEDVLLVDLIAAATERVDGQLGELCVQLTTAQYEARFPGFVDVLDLFISPVQSIDSVTYTDPDGVQRTDDPAHWRVVDEVQERWAYMERTPETPTLPATKPGASVVVRFTAGFGGPSAVPAVIRHVIRMYVATLYDQREAIRFGTGGYLASPDVKAMLSAYRRGWNC